MLSLLQRLVELPNLRKKRNNMLNFKSLLMSMAMICTATAALPQDRAIDYVNPFIGTALREISSGVEDPRMSVK
jgi:hypothetical protein